MNPTTALGTAWRATGRCLIACTLLAAPLSGQSADDAPDAPEAIAADTHPASSAAAGGKPDGDERGVALLPFVAPPRDFDWIQLTSDEWLKGELTAMYKKRLEFDSDELDLLKFDWEDVRQVWSHQPVALRLEGRSDAGEPRVVYGTVHIDATTITVTNALGTQEFTRDSLVSIAPGAESELQRWSGDLSLGANLREGNSDQAEFSAILSVKRRTAASRFLLDYLGSITEIEGEETANNHRVSSSYDVFKTRRYFWRQVFAEYFRDPFQNINQRWTAGSAFGYTIIETARTEWDLTIGAGYQYLEYVSVEAGEKSDNTSPLLAFTTLYDTELTSWIDYDLSYEFFILDKDSGSYTHHLVSTVSTDLIGNLDFDVSFVWDRIEDPQPNDDGTLPEQDDFRLIVGLGWDF